MSLLRGPELVGAEYPAWVKPHASHVVELPHGGLVVADHEFHVDRAGNITALAADAEDEALLTSEKAKLEAPAFAKPEAPVSAGETTKDFA